MNDCNCKNKAQCWEPCGELGHSEKHAIKTPTDEEFNRVADQVMQERKEILRRLTDEESIEVDIDEL